VAELVYTAICSLDGYVVDADGNFDWAAPDEEVHAHVNEGERGIGTYLLGRRMYEVLRYWDADDPEADRSTVIRDYRRLWQAADKVVYSTTLEEPSTPRTVLRREFEADDVRRLKERADLPVSIGGPTLAGLALQAGLVDVLRLYRHPVLVGGGTPALPPQLRANLELEDVTTFGGGVVFTQHRVRVRSGVDGA
jgi:dihydrofolate reductase